MVSSYFLLNKTAWFGGCSDSDNQKPSVYLFGPFRKLLEEAHGDQPGHPPRSMVMRGDGGDAKKQQL